MSATLWPTTAARPFPLRVAVAATLIACAAASLFATPADQTAQAIASAGPELTTLLRAMAVLKLALVAGGAWLVDWRLRFPVSPLRGGLYLAGLAMMAAGPGLIWTMAHLVVGAALLHGGLVLLALVLWRDPGSPAMLARR